MVRFAARFRFVDAAVLAARFGVSERRAQSRVARLLAAGVLGRRAVGGGPALLYVTPAGARVLGLGRRRVPRVLYQREHELAAVGLVVALERREALRATPGRVLSERECRQREGAGEGAYSVLVHGEPQRRWPDVVLERAGRATVGAFELEFAPKASRRLRAIVRGYRDAGHMHRVTFIVASPALGVRIARLARSEGAGARVGVAPWDEVSPAVREEIERRAGAALEGGVGPARAVA